MQIRNSSGSSVSPVNPMTPVNPVNAFPGNSSPGRSGCQSGFATLLQRQHPPAVASTPKPDTPDTPEPSHTTPDITTATETPAAPALLRNNVRTPQHPKPARIADPSSPSRTRWGAGVTTDDPAANQPDARSKVGADEAPVGPFPGPWIACLQQPVEWPLPATGPLRSQTIGTGTGDTRKHTGIAASSQHAAALNADPESATLAVRGAGDRSTSAPETDFAAALAIRGPTETPSLRVNATPAALAAPLQAAAPDTGSTPAAVAAAIAATAAAFIPTPNATRDTAAPLVVNVPTPVNAPDFAQNLGLQLSLLTRDGMQRAELHLNPAHMGPVSVHITVDGTQARIDFGADLAATRHTLEVGMPVLASALADAGFTLAGGGVSQHPNSRGESRPGESDPRPGTRRASAVGSASEGVRLVTHRTVSAGGIDLYA